ncbi:MAG: hypothetical protein JWP43_1400 [Ramlibacter sp.]|jgi:hypothetical protein|nr:hypothetical protein [Ramlibacter sp.]
MTTIEATQSEQMQDRFGRLLAARLSVGTAELGYDIAERLRAARVQAVAKRKPAALRRTAAAVTNSGGAATLNFGDEGQSLWNRIASVLPLVALVAGLFVIQIAQDERRAHEVAEVDAALLTDDLPPAAYADPGFLQFLKTGGE